MKNLIFVAIFSSILFSCSSIYLKSYGLKKEFSVINEENKITIAKEYKIPLEDWYDLNFSFYNYLLSLDKNEYRKLINDHLQPLQVMYFDKTGNNISYHINCYTGGFPNLKWNRDKSFNTFPPSTIVEPDTIVTLPLLLTHLDSNLNTNYNPLEYDFTVMIVWGDYMGRQAKRLIDLVQNNIKLADKNTKIKILYINNDKFDAEVQIENLK